MVESMKMNGNRVDSAVDESVLRVFENVAMLKGIGFAVGGDVGRKIVEIADSIIDMYMSSMKSIVERQKKKVLPEVNMVARESSKSEIPYEILKEMGIDETVTYAVWTALGRKVTRSPEKLLAILVAMYKYFPEGAVPKELANTLHVWASQIRNRLAYLVRIGFVEYRSGKYYVAPKVRDVLSRYF